MDFGIGNQLIMATVIWRCSVALYFCCQGLQTAKT